MKLSLQLFKLFCCCAALCSATLAQRSTGTISGQVIGDDGQPLTRATVTVVPANAGGDVSKLMSGRLAISTDLNVFNVDHPVVSLAETMSKVWALGVPLEPALKLVKFEAPATRSRGVMVKDAQELVDALKKKGLL